MLNPNINILGGEPSLRNRLPTQFENHTLNNNTMHGSTPLQWNQNLNCTYTINIKFPHIFNSSLFVFIIGTI